MTATDSLAGWLGARSDAQLVMLLQLRPDLAVPLPSSMAVLATRAEQRASVLRATEDLDTLEFAILEILVVHGVKHTDRDRPPLRRDELHVRLSGRVASTAIDDALEHLTARALVWTDDDELHVIPAAAEALPWPIGSATELPDTLTEPEVVAALPELAPPNAPCWTSWPRRARVDAPGMLRRAPRPTAPSSASWRSGCCTGSMTRPSSFQSRSARCCAANRSPTRMR